MAVLPMGKTAGRVITIAALPRYLLNTDTWWSHPTTVGTTILQAAREMGVDIDSICGGRARCGRCQVEPLEGTFAKEGMISSPTHLDELSET
jgi:Na+-transporting NADH:ubiquinone oxidoreductase subunit NqrF